MANKKITELTAAASVLLTDLLAVVSDPGGTPTTKKATIQVLANLLVPSKLVVFAHRTGSAQAIPANNENETYLYKPTGVITDTDSCFSTSTGKATIPSGRTGNFLVVCNLKYNSTAWTKSDHQIMCMWKNGTYSSYPTISYANVPVTDTLITSQFGFGFISLVPTDTLGILPYVARATEINHSDSADFLLIIGPF